MAAEIFAGINALKTAFDIAKGIKDIDDRARINSAVIELQEKILSAQQAQATLVETVSNLEKEVTRLTAWDVDKRRYKLTEVRPGALAYALKEGMEAGEPPHHLCTSCYHAGHKSILFEETWNPGRADVLVCHDCGAYLYVHGMASPEHAKQKPKPYRGA